MAAVAVALLVGANASFGALVLNVGPGGTSGDHILGEEIPQQFGGAGGLDARDAATINYLLGMALGARTATDYRSTTSYGVLPAATVTGALHAGTFADMTTFGNDSIKITLPNTTTYQYLVGAYDGTQSGVQVWYIGNLAAGTEILIPRYARPVSVTGGQDLINGFVPGIDGSKFQITTWNLMNPTPVPEPSTVIAGALLLLPFAASTIRFARRNRKS